MSGRRTIVFDVNETLSDMSGVAERVAAHGAPASMAATWFAATLRDGFALTMTDGPQAFARVGRAVLIGLLTPLDGLDGTPQDIADDVLSAFTELPVHPDVPAGVVALSEAGHRLVTMSNGAVTVAESLLARAGLREHFELILTVDDAGAWKPDRRAYDYAVERSGVAASDAVMLAVHPWDLHGAACAGMSTAFLDRSGAPWPDVFAAPDHHVRALAELAAALA